jgi:NADPH-ferrihemoprotein reductase
MNDEIEHYWKHRILEGQNTEQQNSVENRNTGVVQTGRSARHVELDVNGRLQYTTGDHVGIFPMNDFDLVERCGQESGLNGIGS